ncbi:MAG TPA: hypothetical protein VIL85_19665 [Thermomicrobiales bacterium]|jgi:hypothetical protein
MVGQVKLAFLVAGTGVLLATLVACAARAGSSPTPITPITSAGDLDKPVPFRWTLAPAGVLHIQGGTPHAIASEVRLLDDTNRTMASVPTRPLGAGDAGLCDEDQSLGLVAADLRLPDAGRWPDRYRLEARVGAAWRPTQLTRAC